jgi:hypothetical protein
MISLQALYRIADIHFRTMADLEADVIRMGAAFA